MKKTVFAVIAVLSALMLISIVPVKAPAPRHCKGLDIYYYENSDVAFAALLACEVDFIQWSLTFPQYVTATETPDLQLAGYAENGMMELDLNNNYTVSPYLPGIRSMMNDVEFRRALAHMVDKDWIVEEVIQGFAEKLLCPVCAPQAGYADPTCCDDPYPYSIATANSILDAAGYLDHDSDGWRNYPVGWPGAVDVDPADGMPDNLDPVKMCIRNDHGHRLTVGREMVRVMEEDCNIPTTGAAFEASSDVLYPMVMDNFDYHLYTGGWNLGRYPTYLYGLYHHDNYYPGGSNYITAHNESGDPNYPDIDEATYNVRYAVTEQAFRDAVIEATNLITCVHAVNIPLWSYVSYWAYKKYLVGIVNMMGYGLENTFTFLNAYKIDDGATPEDESQDPIRMGTVNAPKDLNLLYSTWYYDYAVLDRLTAGLLSVNPYNLALDQPWVAQDWDESTWFDPEDQEEKTKVTYWIRKDVWWHAPVTGEVVRQCNAHDVDFTIWYFNAFPDGWLWSAFQDVKFTRLLDDFTIEVYFDSLSIWHKYNPTGPILPKYELLATTLLTTEVYEWHVEVPINPSDKVVLPPYMVQIIDVIKLPEEIPLIEGVDFIVERSLTDHCHNRIHWLRPLEPSETIIFTFWAPTGDPHGTFLGNLPWEETMYTLGPYVPIALAVGVGEQAILDCNPTHFLGAPPLGEIDWVWYWDQGPKPRTGYYQINLFDAVTLLKAYGTRGDGVPPANWEPGADLDQFQPCQVALYDAVLLLTNYGVKFGIPPDP
jgi:hypothetical protein